MADITKNIQYMEGFWQGKTMAKNVDKTTYETIDGAITSKQALIDNFEKEFGFSREDDPADLNYAFNLGILDALIEYKQTSEN